MAIFDNPLGNYPPPIEGLLGGVFAEVLELVRAGELRFDNRFMTEGLQVNSAAASRLISAAAEAAGPDGVVVWAAGTAGLHLEAPIGCDLKLYGDIDGDLVLAAPISGSLLLANHVRKLVQMEAPIEGNLIVEGRFDHWFELADGFSVQTLAIEPSTVIAGPLVAGVGGRCRMKSLELKRKATIESWFQLGAGIHVERVVIGGSVHEDVVIDAKINESLVFSASSVIGGDVRIAHRGRVGVPTAGRIRFHGVVEGLVDLQSSEPNALPVESLSGAKFRSPVQLGSGVDLAGCDFGNFSGFEHLRFLDSSLFPTGSSGRQQVNTVFNKRPATATEAANLYRNLRVVLERQGNRPAASDFYYGEMENRRLASSGAERAILMTYKLVSQYGTRSLRAVAWFVGLILVGAAAFAVGGFDPNATDPPVARSLWNGWGPGEVADLILFTIRSAVSLFNPPAANLSTVEGYVQTGVRFLGPVLLAQIVLAFRERVAR